MSPQQQATLLKRILEDMQGSPDSGATIIFHFEGGAGARGTLPAWNSLRSPRDQLAKLVTGVMNKKTVEYVDFELDAEQAGDWLVLFAEGQDCGSWKRFRNMTRSQVGDKAGNVGVGSLLIREV